MITNKKILVVTTTDNMIWQFLLPHIRHLQDAGNIVECACARTGFWFDEMREKLGLIVHEINFKRNPFTFKLKGLRQNAKAYKALKHIVGNGGFDLIHCHQPVGGVMGRKVGDEYKIPVIYTAHGFHFYKGAPLKALVYKIVEKYYAKKTAALITMNDEDFQSAKKMKAKHVYKINGIGYDPAKNEAFQFDEEAIRKEIGLSPDDIVLINIGECIKRKNQTALFDVVKRLGNSSVKLLVCGNGKLYDDYCALIKKLGLTGEIKMLGYRKDVRNFLKIANLFVFSPLQEGLPMAVMEAMHEGLPIIASNIRGNCDLVKHESNGLLVNLQEKNGFLDAVKRLIYDKETCIQMGARSKELVRSFFVSEVLEQMEVIYDDVFRS